jgi:phosphoribosylformylglycinamidine cyclo-ligase
MSYNAWLRELKEHFGIDSKSYGGRYPLNERELLVACTDGVGSKLLLAEERGYLNNIGDDLVAMVVNDCISTGAKPLFLVDYISTKSIEKEELSEIVESISHSCKENGVAFLGGETAEHDYAEHYDLSATCVGLVEKEREIVGVRDVREGDLVVALPSNGFHSNGYSLLRSSVLRREPTLWSDEELMRGTKIYYRELSSFREREKIHGIAHITGGGLFNICRVLPKQLSVQLHRDKMSLPSQFIKLLDSKLLEREVMESNLNMGVGLAIIAERDFVHANRLEDFTIGEILPRVAQSLLLVGEYRD